MRFDKSIGAAAASTFITPMQQGPSGNGGSYRPLRCRGDVVFASALAADFARLLDVDPEVEHWRCRVPFGDQGGVADFSSFGSRGEELLLVIPQTADPGHRHPPRHVRLVGPDDIDPVRLENAKAILPFARWRVSLDDRIRLLAVLDDEGSVTLADCLGILRNTSRPVAAVASLALARIVDLDLDEPIGSRTRVIRREA